MSEYTSRQIEIEKKEYETLKNLNFIFKDSLKSFDSGLKDSLSYIYYITLPIIMASLENKSFNPFSEIIEKHISFIVNTKMISMGYKMVPLGYSSDLTFEDDESIINIDIKTANINNPSDFKEEIALGFNQTSYPGKLPCGIRGKTEYYKDGVDDIKTFPNLPEVYNINSKTKCTITNGLLFIYPDYKVIIDGVRNDYLKIRKILDENLVMLFKTIFSNKDNMRLFLDYKPKAERFARRELIVDNLVRAYYIHKKSLDLPDSTLNKLRQFSDKVFEISEKLSKREIKPVAIISISIPNGMLAPHYDSQVVSGKSFGKSIRYHYEDGIFKGLTGQKSRVIFIDYNENYIEDLKKYFRKIVTYDIKEKEI